MDRMCSDLKTKSDPYTSYGMQPGFPSSKPSQTGSSRTSCVSSHVFPSLRHSRAGGNPGVSHRKQIEAQNATLHLSTWQRSLQHN